MLGIMNYDSASYGQLIDNILKTQSVLVFCLLISSFYLATNAYAGFITVFTAFMFAAFIGVTYYGIRLSPSRTFYGAILGACIVLLIVSLQLAIFWGQYSGCLSMDSGIVYTGMPSVAPTEAPVSRMLYAQEDQQQFQEQIDVSDLIQLTTSSLLSIDSSKESSTSRYLRNTISVVCYHKKAMKSVCAFSVFMFLSYIALIYILFQHKHDILGSAPLDEGYGQVPSNDSLSPVPWKKEGSSNSSNSGSNFK